MRRHRKKTNKENKKKIEKRKYEDQEERIRKWNKGREKRQRRKSKRKKRKKRTILRRQKHYWSTTLLGRTTTMPSQKFSLGHTNLLACSPACSAWIRCLSSREKERKPGERNPEAEWNRNPFRYRLGTGDRPVLFKPANMVTTTHTCRKEKRYHTRKCVCNRTYVLLDIIKSFRWQALSIHA